MKVVYMGTPDFAVPALCALVEAGHDVRLVVTKADRPKDRGKKLQSCPVKLKAAQLGLNVETPEKIKVNEEFLGLLKEINPDIIVVAAYGKIIPKTILELPKFGCINIHGSLLPRYRGPAPIQRSVINGDEFAGITLMHMAEGMDTGDMIAKVSTPIGEKTTAEVYDELAKKGADLLIEYLPLIENGTAPREVQDESLATYAPMVFKEEGVLDYSKTAKELCCIVRGFNSWPSASTTYNGMVFKVHKAVIGREGEFGEFGKIITADKKGIEVACNGGTVILTNIQAPGKKAMDVSAFLLGNKIEIGSILR